MCGGWGGGVRVCVDECVCVCMCVCVRERERGRVRERGMEAGTKRESIISLVVTGGSKKTDVLTVSLTRTVSLLFCFPCPVPPL